MLLGYAAISYVDNFGQWELHLENKEGPICESTNKPDCDQYFILDKEVSEDDIQVVLAYIWTMVVISGFVGAIMIIAFFYWKPRIKKVKTQLDEIEDDYLLENYMLTFNTSIPEGRTNGEKVFNLAQKIFPELRKLDGSEEVWKGSVTGHNGFDFDCYQTTNIEKRIDSEIFIVKYFEDEKITISKLKELIKEQKK